MWRGLHWLAKDGAIWALKGINAAGWYTQSICESIMLLKKISIWSSLDNARGPTHHSEKSEIIMSLNSWKKTLKWGFAWSWFILEMVSSPNEGMGRVKWGFRTSQGRALYWGCHKEIGPLRNVQNASQVEDWDIYLLARNVLLCKLQVVLRVSSLLCFWAVLFFFFFNSPFWQRVFIF